MDIQKLIKEHGAGLVQQLTSKAGFSPQQAQGFLPPIIGKVLELVKGGGLDLKALLGGTDFSGLISKLGLGQIAKLVGIDEQKAMAGATAVIPGVVQLLQKETGGLGAIKEAASGVLKKATALFSAHQ